MMFSGPVFVLISRAGYMPLMWIYTRWVEWRVKRMEMGVCLGEAMFLVIIIVLRAWV